jgi:hypothetical protein
MTEDNVYYNQAGATGAGTPGANAQTPSPAEQAPNAGADQEARSDEVITAAKLNKILEAQKAEWQKQQDKLVTHLDKRVDKAKKETEQAIANLKANGIPLTAEQEANAMTSAVQKALVSGSAEEPSQGSQRVESDPIAVMVNREVAKIMEKTGVHVTPEEAKEKITDYETPIEFVRKFEEYCNQKANPIQPSARIPTLATSGNNVPGIEVLKQQYESEKAQILAGTHPTVRMGNHEAVTKWKNEYAKKGLKTY